MFKVMNSKSLKQQKREKKPPVAPVLKKLLVLESTEFPLCRRSVVRSTITTLQDDANLMFLQNF